MTTSGFTTRIQGGPLGELVQWADLIGALDSSNLISFRIIISIDELGLIKGKTCYEETEFPNIDFLITDITGGKERFFGQIIFNSCIGFWRLLNEKAFFSFGWACILNLTYKTP